MKNIRKNKGISLIQIAIVCAIIIILAGVVIQASKNYISVAKKSSLDKSLSDLKDELFAYVHEKGELPLIKNEYGLARTYDINRTPSLKQEIKNSKDIGDTFYIVDMKLLGAANPSKGADIVSDDVFIMASKTYNVYYAKGEKLQDKVYHGYVDNMKDNNLVGYITFTTTDEADFKQENSEQGTDFIDGEVRLHYNQ